MIINTSSQLEFEPTINAETVRHHLMIYHSYPFILYVSSPHFQTPHIYIYIELTGPSTPSKNHSYVAKYISYPNRWCPNHTVGDISHEFPWYKKTRYIPNQIPWYIPRFMIKSSEISICLYIHDIPNHIPLVSHYPGVKPLTFTIDAGNPWFPAPTSWLSALDFNSLTWAETWGTCREKIDKWKVGKENNNIYYIYIIYNISIYINIYIYNIYVSLLLLCSSV